MFRNLILSVISDIQQIKSLCQKWRAQGESIAFVPTMGCLHTGHLSLVKKAEALADHVVVSIFVNPLQFNDPDDLLKYPKILGNDINELELFSVDAIFTPDRASFYPEGEDKVELLDLGEITTILEGENRPGHFAGVATVVKRLFDIVQPNYAIFGEKDFQQLMVVRLLVERFSLDIEIVGMPTLREQDGLAMSSRNLRLSDDERAKASIIYENLMAIKAALNKGNVDFTELERSASENLTEAGFIPDYVAIRNTEQLLAPENHSDSMVILVAAKLGEIRLIDNIRV